MIDAIRGIRGCWCRAEHDQSLAALRKALKANKSKR